MLGGADFVCVPYLRVCRCVISLGLFVCRGVGADGRVCVLLFVLCVVLV